MNKEKKKFFSAKNITFFAVLLALVIVLQVFGSYFKIGETSLSFVLVPIVLGGILLGPVAGALLGFSFGLIVVIYGVTGVDAFTNMLFNAQPFMTILLCLVKGTAAGFIAGLLYKLVAKKNSYVAVFVASVSAPIVNTGLFILGSLCMSETMEQLFGVHGSSLMYFLFITCAGVNFLIELAINIVCSPALSTVTKVVEKQILKKYKPQKAENGEQE